MTHDVPPTAEALQAEITVLQQRIAELEASHAALTRELAVGRTLMRNFPEGVVLTFDHDLRFTGAYGRAPDRGAMTLEQIIGYSIAQVMPPDVAAALEAPMRAALAGEETTVRVRFGGGNYQSLVLPVRDAEKQIVAGMIISYDITTRARAEEQLRVFEHLVAHAPDGILVRVPEGTITYANPALQSLSGYGEQFVGMHAAVLVHASEQAIVPIIGELMASRQPWSGRIMYQRADQTIFPAQVTVFPIPGTDTDVPLVGAIIRDISAVEQAARDQEEQLRAAQDAAIRELATPLIPLAQEIVVMPLVGTIDNRRTQQVLETLLEGIVQHQAEYAILDVTGVRMVDTQVAQALLRVAQAAKLLGAQIILSGLGASIAQTLVYLDVDLAEIVTVSNLQAGIAYALEQRSAQLRA